MTEINENEPFMDILLILMPFFALFSYFLFSKFKPEFSLHQFCQNPPFLNEIISDIDRWDLLIRPV